MPGTPSTQSGGAPRAPLMRRESSQTSHTSKHGVQSPGSGEYPLRHAVKPAARHKAVVLPRNHSSARNLQKLNRQAQVQHVVEEGRKNTRQRSHEGDTEIRLPGSLDESRPPPMRRNWTAYQLPRNTSHTKLKKNLSHGQLTRLGSAKNLPTLNGKASKKRPKSEDFSNIEKDLHEQEVELAQQQQAWKEGGAKKVGFAVGSEGDEGDDGFEEMEGSGLQEDEWTDQSASASPFSTRQNTANNSRRASMILEKPPDKAHSPLSAVTNQGPAKRQQEPRVPMIPKSNLNQNESSNQFEEGDGNEDVDEEVSNDAGEDADEDEDDEEPASPRSMPPVKKRGGEPANTALQLPQMAKITPKSPLHAAKDQPSPATQRILSRNTHSPAPALVSNISAMDDAHSTRPSPAPSMRSSKSNIGEGSLEQDQDELVSRFIPSSSHPNTGSGANTAMNTPKTNSFHTPESESTLAQRDRDTHRSQRQRVAVSPGSTVSGSSGHTTPAMARSRTELRMMNDKAMADREDQARHNPVIPPHVFDRRNESLKYGNAESGALPNAQMKPELFQGRFKAVNTELKVVQRFRDPIGEAISRISTCKGSSFPKLRGQKSPLPQLPSGRLAISKSTTQLSRARGPSNLSTSTSPPKATSPGKPALAGSKSTTQLRRGHSSRGKVTFSQTAPDTQEVPAREEEHSAGGADEVARQMWEGVL